MMAYDVVTKEEMRDCPGEWLFADGGVIGVNPSPHGGTWAWVRVKDGEAVCSASGVITPAKTDLPAVSNNISELYALVRGIANLPDGWTGTIVSDSHVTLCRRVPHAKMNGVPDKFALYARAQFNRVLDTCRFVLVDGHPTKVQLAEGIGKRGGHVSKWNQWCDHACTAAGKPAGTLEAVK